MRQSGFTAVEIVTLFVMMGVLVALVVVLMPAPVVQVEVREVKVDLPGTGDVTFAPESFTFAPKELRVEPGKVVLREPEVIEEAPPFADEPPAPVGPRFQADKVECMNNMRNLVGLLVVSGRYPEYSGPNLLLYLVLKGEIGGEHLPVLFCPGDREESLAMAGGADAYMDLDLKQAGAYGHLTSYAGRALAEPDGAIEHGDATIHVLACDDSEDHHGNRGFVVGLTNGAARWRDKMDDWALDLSTPVVVGKDSVVKELTCLREE